MKLNEDILGIIGEFSDIKTHESLVKHCNDINNNKYNKRVAESYSLYDCTDENIPRLFIDFFMNNNDLDALVDKIDTKYIKKNIEFSKNIEDIQEELGDIKLITQFYIFLFKYNYKYAVDVGIRIGIIRFINLNIEKINIVNDIYYHKELTKISKDFTKLYRDYESIIVNV